jgi:lipopolysaccharide transport system permease protein
MGVIPLLVATVVLIAFTLIGGHFPSPAIAILPYSVILLFAFVSGVGLFLGALNVFLRDTSLILSNVLTIMLFISPIFYPVNSYPPLVRGLVVYNPFYVLAECFRMPIVNGVLPPAWMLVYMTLLSTALFLGGLWWFRRLKSFFDMRL